MPARSGGFLTASDSRRTLPDLSDEVVFSTTQDGLRLALHHHRPAGRASACPVILCHGIATNKFGVDLDATHSLAVFLKSRGFDVFAVSLRGAGLSDAHPPGRPAHFSFDDYVRLDAPAIIQTVRHATGSSSVSWVGYSLGGMIGSAVCDSSGDEARSIACLVTLGSPGRITHATGSLVDWAVQNAWINRLVPLRPLSHILAPFGGYVHTPIDRLLYNPAVVSRSTVQKLLRYAIEDINRGVIEQIAGWVRDQHETSCDGIVDYRAALSRIRVPSLFIAGAGDRVAPAEQVRFAHDSCRARHRRFVLAGMQAGFLHDYCHIGLAMGDDAPREIFPHVETWLKQHGMARRRKRTTKK